MELEDITLFGKTYKWTKPDECGSGRFLDLSSMEEDDLEELKKIIVLDDNGVACFEHEDYGWVQLEPHCIECGRRVMYDGFGYITKLVYCENDFTHYDHCYCEDDEESEEKDDEDETEGKYK